MEFCSNLEKTGDVCNRIRRAVIADPSFCMCFSFTKMFPLFQLALNKIDLVPLVHGCPGYRGKEGWSFQHCLITYHLCHGGGMVFSRKHQGAKLIQSYLSEGKV